MGDSFTKQILLLVCLGHSARWTVALRWQYCSRRKNVLKTVDVAQKVGMSDSRHQVPTYSLRDRSPNETGDNGVCVKSFSSECHWRQTWTRNRMLETSPPSCTRGFVDCGNNRTERQEASRLGLMCSCPRRLISSSLSTLYCLVESCRFLFSPHSELVLNKIASSRM